MAYVYLRGDISSHMLFFQVSKNRLSYGLQ